MDLLGKEKVNTKIVPTYSGKLVTGIANKHTSLANSPITNRDTFDES